MFETPTGTTQLDFAIVSAFGIFIVEVKNYSGWIFGDPNDKRWTQSLKGGRKFPFQNPIHQNFKHLAVLAEKTGIPQNLIFPLVAFADGCDFKTEMPANVMHFDGVADYIQKFKSIIIKPEQLTEIMEAFLSWDNVIDREKKREHVQNLKEAHAPASATSFAPCAEIEWSSAQAGRTGTAFGVAANTPVVVESGRPSNRG